MFTDLEMACIATALGFGTGFAIEYGKLDARDTYRSALGLLALSVAIVCWTGNVWEFMVVAVPVMTTHLLARWLFGPPKQE